MKSMPASATGVGVCPRKPSFPDRDKDIETKATLLLVISFLVVTIGGIVEIAPLFHLQNTIEKVGGTRWSTSRPSGLSQAGSGGGTTDYHILREIVESWVLLAIFLFFVAMILWPFRYGRSAPSEDAG